MFAPEAGRASRPACLIVSALALATAGCADFANLAGRRGESVPYQVGALPQQPSGAVIGGGTANGVPVRLPRSDVVVDPNPSGAEAIFHGVEQQFGAAQGDPAAIDRAFLRSRLNKLDGRLTTALVVVDYAATPPPAIASATDETGAIWPVSEIDRTIELCAGGQCIWRRVLSVEIDTAWFRDRPAGFAVNLSAPEVEPLTYRVSAEMMAGQRRALERYGAPLP